jgi:signal transduction histidine kinase
VVSVFRVLAGTVLADAVLTGRDEPPAWHSAASRRVALWAAWLGWGLLAVSGIAAVTIGVHDHAWRGGPGGAGLHNGQVPGGAGVLGWLAVLLAVSAALPLLPRFPLLGWRIAWLAVLVTPLLPGQNRVNTAYYLILAVAFAVAGLRYGPPRLWAMAFLMLVPAWLWTGPDWTYPIRLTISLAVLTGVLYGARRWRRDRLALAATRREAREQADSARQHAALAQRHSERSAVLEERARIAREMHDVVAHHMSMIAVQAETAPYRVPGLPEAARAEFAALGDSARAALTDMRRLLGSLRAPEVLLSTEAQRTDPERLPQPELSDVPELVDSVRGAGAEVILEMPGRLPEVPGVVGLAAYRIVQESLSNAGRHAPGAAIRVSVGEGDGSVLVDVTNGPPGAAVASPAARPSTGPPGGGQGLAGMRERVALLGGEFKAGPRADGGYAVRASLPIGGDRRPPAAPGPGAAP